MLVNDANVLRQKCSPQRKERPRVSPPAWGLGQELPWSQTPTGDQAQRCTCHKKTRAKAQHTERLGCQILLSAAHNDLCKEVVTSVVRCSWGAERKNVVSKLASIAMQPARTTFQRMYQCKRLVMTHLGGKVNIYRRWSISGEHIFDDVNKSRRGVLSKQY